MIESPFSKPVPTRIVNLYPFEPKALTIPAEHDSHVALYDACVFMKYRQAAKSRGDFAMTYWLKVSINIYMFPFRSIRQQLQNHFPNYLDQTNGRD